jgi:molybdenum cofactor cytidylyltransferase
MHFGMTPLELLEGAILAHSVKLDSLTMKKGRRLSAGDVAALREAGVDGAVAARLEATDVHEDEAARRLGVPLKGEGLRARAPFTGRVNLYAETDGLLCMDVQAVNALNRCHEALTLATLPQNHWVSARQMVATIKVIPFSAPADAVAACEALASHVGLCVRKPVFKRVGLIQTRLGGMRESVLDKTTVVLKARIEGVSGELLLETRCEHTPAAVADALRAQADAGVDLVLIAGASANVDRRDIVPAGIEAAGGEVLHFGMPVDPGNLVLLARRAALPVIGLPGCARSPAFNGFDHVLRRLATDMPVTSEILMNMGVGGLLKESAGRPTPRDKPTSATMSQAPRIAGLILAAGQSRRMGESNKLLEILDGTPMVRRCVDAVVGARLDHVIVVTGHESEAVASTLGELDVRLVHNPDFDVGLSTSLAVGLASLPDGVDAVLVCLGDMPRLDASVIDSLVAAYDPVEGRTICVPTWKGKRGNPVLFDARYFAAMSDVHGDVGARHLLGEHADQVCDVAVPTHAVLEDVDSPAELATLRAQWSESTEPEHGT